VRNADRIMVLTKGKIAEELLSFLRE